MDTPLIIVTGSLLRGDDSRPPRAIVNAAYLRAVEGAGGIPVLLVPGTERAAMARLIERCDGLLLTGGGDVAPARYGERDTESRYVSEERDEMEFAALEVALDRDMPVLAICRGMQVLNVALGGSLWQDLPSQRASGVQHRQNAGRDVATHDIRVEEGSRLAGVLGDTCVATNSMHHQGVRVLAERLRAVGWADDGLVEGVEMAERRFVLGVQWHPEELIGAFEHARRLFAAFVEAARA